MAQALIPFDERDGVIWFNGQFVPWREAKVHVLTHGLHYGSCVFEGDRAYGGAIFKLEEHTARLFRSAKLMDMKIPYSEDQVNAACREVVQRQGFTDAYVRPVVWRGSEMMAVSAQHNRIHVAVASWQWPSMYDPAVKMKGINLDIARWRRPSPDCAPCFAKAAGLYMICTLSKHEAESKGLQDALMYDYRGFIAEATGANIFFVQDGKLHSPKPDCFLDGITRNAVIALAKARGLEVIDRHIAAEELSSFSECFITGTAAEVTPVAKIGDLSFTPGKISETLMNDFTAAVRRKKAA